MKKMRMIGLLAGLSACFQLLAGPVNINTADAQTLATELNGVGLSRAEAIVAYRDEHGAFKSVDELANVKGIGPAIVDKNRANILLQGTPAKPEQK